MAEQKTEEKKNLEEAKPQQKPEQKNQEQKKPQKKPIAQDKSTIKLRRKNWYAILAPKMFDEAQMGETIVYEPKDMIGKTVSYNLANLTNDIKKQNTSVKFVVDSVENNKARTKIIGIEIMSYTVKRFVRRSSTKIEISFACATSDNVRMRIKPIIVAKSETKNSVRSKLYKTAINFLTKKIGSEKYEAVINDLVAQKFQTALKGHLNKIYPLKICEIRYAGIEAIKKAEAK